MQACQDVTHVTIASGVTPHLCMCRQGVDLVRAEYIPDDIEDIKQTVLRLKERVGPNGVVFSSGGIGPTHDDVTYEALAAAFGVCSNLDMDSVMCKAPAAGLHWCTCFLCMFTHVRLCFTRLHMHVEAPWSYAEVVPVLGLLQQRSLYCLCQQLLFCIKLQPSNTFLLNSVHWMSVAVSVACADYRFSA